MAVSSGRAGTGLFPQYFDKASFVDSRSLFSYSAGRDGLGYFFEFQKRGATGPSPTRRRLPYFVGSGANASAFLISVAGFHFEASITYYSASGAWNLSPGYTSYSYPFLTRAITRGCLECHS